MAAETGRRDGRRQRAERSHEQVVEALLDLYRAGQLQPSAPTIAAKAGVSERTVFRLFDDLEALALLAMQRQWARVQRFFDPPDQSGDRPQRIAALVTHRLALFAEVAPAARAAQLRAPFSPTVQHGIEARARLLRDHLCRQFATELGALPEDTRADLLAALEAATSIETMLLLHDGQGLPASAIGRVLGRTLRALLADAEQP